MCVVVFVCAQAWAAPPLPALDTYESATVSGLSSGAYMAVQFHVAHFASVMGAGVLAAGRGMLSLDHGISCASTASPYINDCHFDAAGQLLQQVYGPVKPPRPIVRHG